MTRRTRPPRANPSPGADKPVVDLLVSTPAVPRRVDESPSRGSSAEPFVRSFFPFAGLPEPFRVPIAHDLLIELIDDAPQP